MQSHLQKNALFRPCCKSWKDGAFICPSENGAELNSFALKAREREREEWPRDGHLFSTNRPPASSCIWAASHAKRPPVPVQLPLGVWGAPLQQDMCYWLEEKEIRLQNTQTLLLFPPMVFFFFCCTDILLSLYFTLFPSLSLFFLFLPACGHLVMFPTRETGSEGSLLLHDNWAVRVAARRSAISSGNSAFLMSCKKNHTVTPEIHRLQVLLSTATQTCKRRM